jgi:hypothetical protein
MVPRLHRTAGRNGDDQNKLYFTAGPNGESTVCSAAVHRPNEQCAAATEGTEMVQRGPHRQSVTFRWNILPMDRFTLVLVNQTTLSISIPMRFPGRWQPLERAA